MNKKYKIEDFLEIKAAGASSFNYDGSKISFLSDATGMDQLYLVSRDGGETRQLTSHEEIGRASCRVRV